MDKVKCASVSIIGRPSSGKSTLVNTICEMKVSITAASPQTTRNAIRGIYTDQRGQIIFTDTPGYHLSDKVFNQRMKDITCEVLNDSDIILYLIDGTRDVKKEEEAIAAMLKKIKRPIIVVINKMDVATNVEEIEEYINKEINAVSIIKASGKKDEGVDDILIKIFELSPLSDELMYPEDKYTDQDLEFRISEIIREKVISNLSDEMPHVIFVEIADIEYNDEEKTVWIRAFINVERDGQKGMIVGKEGKNIKRIRKQSFTEIKRIFPTASIHLDLRVKSQSKWRNNSIILDKIFR